MSCDYVLATLKHTVPVLVLLLTFDIYATYAQIGFNMFFIEATEKSTTFGTLGVSKIYNQIGFNQVYRIRYKY